MKDPIMDLCDVIRETSYSIHRYLQSGHLERVYENCLAHRLRKRAITLQQQYPIDVYDEDGTDLGHFVADLLVENQLIVELKACSMLLPEHTAQYWDTCAGADYATRC
jgi:GxxExxY protein